MIELYAISFILPLLLCLFWTPLVIRFAHKIGAVDKPDPRKVHQQITPRLGGLAIFLSCGISFLILTFIFRDLSAELAENIFPAAMILFCLTLTFLLGLWDDLTSLKPGLKFGVQFLIATMIYFAGFKISNITHPLGSGVLNVELIDFPLTVLWIVGIINAFNLIDGLDGLASGVASIACFSMFILSAISGDVWTGIAALTLGGALVGFLRYNFNPAKIFLGDSGSLVIGFSLALLSIHSTTKITTGFAVLFPLLVLALPITDTLISMIRRLLGSFLNEKNEQLPTHHYLLRKLHGMFTPDKSHIHHQLLSLGLSHRNTVLVLYSVSGVFAFGAFLFTQTNTFERSLAIMLIFGFLLIAGVKKLQYREIAIFNNGLIMPLFEKWILNHKALAVLTDICFIGISFFLSYSLVNAISPEISNHLHPGRTLVAILSVQMIIFFISGIYKDEMKTFGIGNALRVTSSVAYSVLSMGFIITMFTFLPFIEMLQLLIHHFYFLLSLVLGFRIAYRALGFLFNRHKLTGENVLIYGASENGTMLLHKINNTTENSVKVLGFLDDNPDLAGKMIYGYPIFGGHWILPKLLSHQKVDSIYICNESIKPENYRRLKRVASLKNIAVKKLQVRLNDLDEQGNAVTHNIDFNTDSKISCI